MYYTMGDPLPSQARLKFAMLRICEHVFGNNLLKQRHLRNLIDKKQQEVDQELERFFACKGEGRKLEMDRRPDLTGEEFRNYYVRHTIPVVMPGIAKNWECVKKWSPQFFADKYGDDRVILINDDIATDESVEEESTLGDSIRSMGTGNFKYARFVPLFHNHPELLDEFDRPWLGKFINGDPNALRLYGTKGKGIGIRSHLFIGEQGASTNLHCALTNNLFVNVYGRKRWIIASSIYDPALKSPVNRGPGVFGSGVNPLKPDYENFPMSRYVDWYEVMLEPGDVLYNPAFYWHHVTNITNNVSVGVRWYSFRDAMQAAPLKNIMSFMATNPTLFAASRNAIEYGKTHGSKKRRDLRDEP